MAVSRPSEDPQAELGEDDDDGAVVVLPMDTILGYLRGSAEMQGQDDLVIGPGIVTHPGAGKTVPLKPVAPDGQ